MFLVSSISSSHYPGADRVSRLLVLPCLATRKNRSRSWPQVVNFGLPTCLVFALWYWRLDGGGPTARRERHEFGSRSFVFPQMQIEKIERGRFECQGWHPHFVDYLFIAWTTSSTFGPTDAPLLARWAKILTMVQIGISLTIVIVLISRAVGVL